MATAEPGPPPPKPACAVTFGLSTLLGRYLAAALAASGRWSAVAILDPSSPTSPSPPPCPPASHLVYHHDVDLSADPERLVSALAGAAAVFHVDATTATASGSDGSFLSLHRLAVEGTRRLLTACRTAGVERVVYTGSADVVAAVARDVINADEDSAPYPDKVWLLRDLLGFGILGFGGAIGLTGRFGFAVGAVRECGERAEGAGGGDGTGCGRGGRDEDVRAATEQSLRSGGFQLGEVCCWICKVSLGQGIPNMKLTLFL